LFNNITWAYHLFYKEQNMNKKLCGIAGTALPLAVLLAFGLVLAGCGTTSGDGNGGGSGNPASPPPSPANSAAVGMDLDAAIREAAAQMEARIPAETMVALVSVASSSAQFSEYVISRLEAALVSGRKLIVVDRANLDRVREEQGFQLSDDVDDNSAKAIGKFLGAGAIVTGAFMNLGDVYSLTLKAINIETATVAASYPADIARSTRIETLLASGGGAARTQTAQRGNTDERTTAQAPATPTAATAPAAEAARVPAAPAPAPIAAATMPAPVTAAAPAPSPTSTFKVGDTGPAVGLVFYTIEKKENAKLAPVTKDYKVGDTGPAGGIIFYVNPSAGEWKYLEAAPAKTEVKTFWASEEFSADSILDIRAVGTGKSNTEFIMKQAVAKGGGFDWAAEVCDALTVNGYDDWFLPSQDELNMMYGNLARKGLGDFKAEWYWSSTPYNFSGAWIHTCARVENFKDGSPSGNDDGAARYDRNRKYWVRAIRQF
jgi:hypothetical protein